jgi:hypothetical protein
MSSTSQTLRLGILAHEAHANRAAAGLSHRNGLNSRQANKETGPHMGPLHFFRDATRRMHECRVAHGCARSAAERLFDRQLRCLACGV